MSISYPLWCPNMCLCNPNPQYIFRIFTNITSWSGKISSSLYCSREYICLKIKIKFQSYISGLTMQTHLWYLTMITYCVGWAQGFHSPFDTRTRHTRYRVFLTDHGPFLYYRMWQDGEKLKAKPSLLRCLLKIFGCRYALKDNVNLSALLNTGNAY